MTHWGLDWNLIWIELKKLVQLAIRYREWQELQTVIPETSPDLPVPDPSSLNNDEDDYTWEKIAK